MSRALPALTLHEPILLGHCAVTAAVDALSNAGKEARGAIFTRREVVEFMLDLTGYRSDLPLHKWRLLEPSFGEGDFLIPAIDRLLESWRASGRPEPLSSLSEAIRGVELHRATFEATRRKVIDHLEQAGVAEAEALADHWLTFGDFLLVDLPLSGSFDVVVGNPPYVRQEMIADVLMNEYRARYRTIYDRADIYVPFIEQSLKMLRRGGQLSFICADRWMKNRYGGPLRQFVADDFHLKIYVDMVDTPAFHSDVIAYPAITVIARERKGVTRVAHRPPIESKVLGQLANALTSTARPEPETAVKEMQHVTDGAEPWIFDSSAELALVRRLERELPPLEAAGCKVGIGVATGADNAFIGAYDELDVEKDRKLPLVMTRDIDRGEVRWRGLGVINPFGAEGRLVDLAHFPKLKRYLEARREVISGRHVAQKAPANWYRTIDRIHPEIAARPKLLIPDIKGAAHIVYENEGLYPHHNLYFITSDSWDLHALQAVLMSGIARLFVAAYSTKMRGGYLRFQAQYLRRIRIPAWADVPTPLKTALAGAGQRRDIESANRAVVALYSLSHEERKILEGSSG